jgi:hypothetical protein
MQPNHDDYHGASRCAPSMPTVLATLHTSYCTKSLLATSSTRAKCYVHGQLSGLSPRAVGVPCMRPCLSSVWTPPLHTHTHSELLLKLMCMSSFMQMRHERTRLSYR